MRAWMIVAVGVLWSSATLADNTDQKMPNFLVIVTDDQRPDTIAALGNPVIRTPNLDHLVERGIAFTRAICANPICTPSRAEIMTGCSSFRNGVHDFGRRIDPQLALWAGTFQKAGYDTFYVGKWHNDGRPVQRGYTKSHGLFASGGSKWMTEQVDHRGNPVTGYRGWIFQNDEGQKFPEFGVGLSSDISTRFADSAIELLRGRGTKPFFLHVNFTAPHDPLLLPPGDKHRYRPEEIRLPKNFLAQHPFDHGNFDGRDEKLLPWPRTPEMIRQELATYYAVISHLDEQIGRVLDTLDQQGLWDNTFVIFTSDHGLAVGSHGLRGKQNMYEHTINVPLIVAGPGIENARQTDAQVYLRELFPTTCELAGLDIPETVEGQSFASVLRGQSSQAHDVVFGYFRNFQRMVRDNRFKLIHYPAIDRYQLFDLETDPQELTDLSMSTEHAPIVAQLRERLESWFRSQGDSVYR